MRLKDVTHINRQVIPETTDPEHSFRYIDISAIDSLGRITTPNELMSFGAAPSRARRLAPVGSTVISTVRTYLRAIAQVPPTAETLLFSTGFAVVEAKSVADDRFVGYVCRSGPFVDEVVARSVGVSYPTINPSELGDIEIALPSLDEQRRIADFLDAETARIDALTEARSRALSLLDERVSAVIRRALQGGNLDSRDVSASAVPWLARHPEHWKAAPLRYLSRIQRGASPRPIEDPIYFDDEGSHGWVRISDVTSSQKYLKSTEQRLSPLGRQLSVPLEPGELFLSIAATVGKPIITRIPCCIHDGFVAIRRPQLNTEFLYYALLLGDAFRGLGKLGTQLNLNSDTVGSIIMPVPPAAEQQMLIAEIEGPLGQISSQRDLISRQLALLFERRQALITAAVTGQVDVTTARGVAP
ncbi:MAG: restriction endonuclease subunit S [Acidobacteria bacterium]|nr:restriction endonuclease subunit S [Acidobacteriota bacterium]